MEDNKNPLDIMGIEREHIIALHEAYTHTNKRSSSRRARRLFDLLDILKEFDKDRNSLVWD